VFPNSDWLKFIIVHAARCSFNNNHHLFFFCLKRKRKSQQIVSFFKDINMGNQSILFLVFILIQIVLNTHALYFHIRETERKCFIEEIPDQTLVIGKYKVELFDATSNTYLPSTPGIGMHVEVKDPEEKIILSKLYTSEGRFTFTSHTPGEHVICLYSNSSAWFGGQQLVSYLNKI
jgi:hypothetical protein